MAGIYTPTTTFYPQGIVTITSNKGASYSTIQASMGSFQYGVEGIYLQANTVQQLFKGITFRSYDANGDINIFLNTTVISPYQYQNSIFLKPIRNDIVLDGRTSIILDALPSENINFVFYTKEQSNNIFLKETKFFDSYFFKQQYDFFNGFAKKD
jgi:hypothetical protein